MRAVSRVSWGRRCAAAFLVVFLGLVLGGCGAVDGMLDTEEALLDEGIRDPSVSFESNNGVDSVYVTWTPSNDTTSSAVAEGLVVSGVVWRVAPLKMDVVETDPDVTPDTDSGSARRVYSRAELEERFGPRPPGLDKEFSELMNLREIAVGVVIGGILFVGVVVLVIVLVVRSSRRKKAAQGQGGGWPPPQGGWQPGYAAQPGYGQPWQPGGAYPPQQGSPYPPQQPGGAYPPQQQPPLYPPQQPPLYPPQPPPPAPGDDPWRPPAG